MNLVATTDEFITMAWHCMKTGLNKIGKSTLFNEGGTKQSSTDKAAVLGFQIDLNLEMLVFEKGGKTRGSKEKTLEQGREPTINSTHIWRTRSGNQTWATVVGGKCSHLCATPTPPNSNSE